MRLTRLYLTLTFIAVMMLYRMFRRPQFGPLTDIFLRLSSADEDTVIWWQHLRFAPGKYKVKHFKQLGRIQLKRLTLTFDTKVSFVERETEHACRLNRSKYISPRQARAVNRITRGGNYSLTLIVTNNSRTVTQTIHERVNNSNVRLAFYEGRVSTQLTPFIQSHAVTVEQTDESEYQTRSTNTQTDTVIEPTAPLLSTPPRISYKGVGRGAALRQIINRP